MKSRERKRKERDEGGKKVLVKEGEMKIGNDREGQKGEKKIKGQRNGSRKKEDEKLNTYKRRNVRPRKRH